MKTLTIFTPTFNRADLLPRLYESLCNQSDKDFCWLIIDDGSKDNTLEIVKFWINENKIQIQYIYQENQGMHGAHNTAYKNIKTELNTCIDSDDFMPNNAVELILNKWNNIDKAKFAGIIGLDADLDLNLIGTNFKTESTTVENFYNSDGTGDKKLVYRTEIINKFPEYPLFENEKYVGLGTKYLQIDKDFELATLNEILVIVDYQVTGSSNTMFSQYLKNPKGFSYNRIISMQLSSSVKRKFIESIHYISTSIILKDTKFLKKSPEKTLTLLAIPFGIVLYFYVLYKAKK